jgi:hypothetical protein
MPGYVIYHKKSKHPYADRTYKTLSAVKAVMRHMKHANEYEYTTQEIYDQFIDYEYIGARGVKVRASTPLCCDPNSETYWSM